MSFSASKLAAAYTADVVLGDPQGMPHPVRVMGKLISYGERLCEPGGASSSDFVRGGSLSLLTVAASWTAGWLAIRATRLVHPAIGTFIEVGLAWTTLATGSLISEAGFVVSALESGQVQEARDSLSMIVGRDTQHLDESEMARAVIETVAESLCDGVIAPLMYLAIGGVPLGLAYKAVNTLDSMIGHCEYPYTYFGRFAARFDDAANFVPARVTALSIAVAATVCSGRFREAWHTWLNDGHRHPSPNAGQSEAAMAGALQVRLGGTNHYQGKPSRKPVLGPQFRPPMTSDARRSLKLARIASGLAFAGAILWCRWRRRA
jgi:adenosylcobinamide-phosphate synthase